jgi:hypothetical protein
MRALVLNRKCALWYVLLYINLCIFWLNYETRRDVFTARYELNIELQFRLIFVFKVLIFTLLMILLEFIFMGH